MSKIAIQLTNISKQYTIHHEKPTLMEKFVKSAKLEKEEKYWALKNINIKINKGESVGLFGPNGSGKTTLLKIISGITTPTSGEIKTKGKVISLIDLEAGFHLDLSGIQNIYLNGMLLGMRKKEIDERLQKITKFADINHFIDAPLFTYSKGMMLRLGFSIAIFSNPEILILDESMGIGDDDFRTKSLAAIKSLYKRGITVLMAMHFIEYLKKYTNRVLFIDKGRIRKKS
ncbi:ABC transporter ATP-binding protein [Patescibacteria group bacterium]